MLDQILIFEQADREAMNSARVMALYKDANVSVGRDRIALMSPLWHAALQAMKARALAPPPSSAHAQRRREALALMARCRATCVYVSFHIFVRWKKLRAYQHPPPPTPPPPPPPHARCGRGWGAGLLGSLVSCTFTHSNQSPRCR